MAETYLESSEKTWLGHPRGLFVLFFAEMWERFSFYGMRGLLVFYLTRHFLFDDAQATGIYATYGSLVYLMPVFGGLIADRYLGARRAIIFGAVLLCLGHLGMAFEGNAAALVAGEVVRDTTSLQTFYFSIAFIIIGVGFLKPNISSIVGQLYGEGDERRDGGFTIFYMGINVGAMVSALTCGYLGETYGWSYGFGLAGIGMLVGLVTFIRGQHLFKGAGEPPEPERLQHQILGWVSTERMIYLLGLLAVLGVWALVQYRDLVDWLLNGTGIIAVLGVIWFSLSRCTKVERDRMFVVLFLTAMSVVFWSLFEQAGSTMTLFADRNVDREFMGITVLASQLQFLNPGFIILLAPLFSMLWVRLARSGYEPSTPLKFGLAIVQVGLGFIALVYGASLADDNGQVALMWLILAYFLHTTGELCLSPVGLSMVTKLSVPRVVGLMMGVWFLASSVSHLVAGLIAGMATVSGGEAAAGEASLVIYTETFEFVAQVALLAGVFVVIVSPLVRRFMHETKMVEK
ncbi:MAG: peptide MFS transporter [Gammaproteobacteria bacterium]|nr:MAG: peptide MFS transporter [Gammaproteobacteria bacterium]